MFSVAHLVRTGYVLGLSVALFLLLRPNLADGQFRGRMPAPHRQHRVGHIPPFNGMMGMGGGMMGMAAA